MQDNFFRWMNYNNFVDGSNCIAPSPSWSFSTKAASVSNTIPLSENQTGALDFPNWIEFGEDFLVKSNINNWVRCSPNGGSLAGYKHGSVKCEIVKVMVPGVCEDVVPHILLLPSAWYGPALFAKDFYYYFDVSSATNWPVADPCGSRGTNHLPNIPDPSGWLYLRESPATAKIDVIHVKNSSNPTGTGFFRKDKKSTTTTTIKIVYSFVHRC